jgi:predicted metalloendopeptidase
MAPAAGLTLFAFAGCEGSAPPAPPQAPTANAGATQAPEKAATEAAAPPDMTAVDESALDRSVAPCEDFYKFACGGWQKATKVPEDEASWTRGFNVIHERNLALLRELLEAYARGERASDPYARVLGDFYTSCMDEGGIEKAGTAPLDVEMAKVTELKDAKGLARAFAKLAKTGTVVPFEFSSGQDLRDATQVVGMLSQGGLGLPDREYYLSDDAKKKEIRGKYEEHVAKMFELLGDKPADAKKAAGVVMKLETALAKASMKREEMRDPKKLYNRLERAGLKKAAPSIDWDAYLDALGAKDVQPINVAQPEFVKALDKLTKSAPIGEWKTYLRWHVVRNFANQLPQRFVDEAFHMRSILRGQAKIQPRWKRCVNAVDSGMGEALGQGFVKATLGAEGKDAVKGLVQSIEHAMAANLKGLAWMDDTTRGRAVEKLEAIGNKIAYPDKWRNYDALTIERGNYLANAARADAFELQRELAKIGKPVDRTEWHMSPPTVNAYYDPQLNEMVFPAGILQPPFYGNRQSQATNFGGIGMVMGHEVTHGFDDEGRQFDAKGNLTDWWTKPVDSEFEKRAACVEKQFSGYVAVGNEHINGKLTLGENIADLGGVKLSYNALHEAMKKSPVATMAGFTPEQQFFLGFAQGWCTVEREEYLRLLVATNPHSPPRFRVIGPLSNMKQFADAFQCKAGDKMVRPDADRCEVW